jgi:hypothetical protein
MNKITASCYINDFGELPVTNNVLFDYEENRKSPFYENGRTTLAYELTKTNCTNKNNSPTCKTIAFHTPDRNYFLIGDILIGIDSEFNDDITSANSIINKYENSKKVETETNILSYEKTLSASKNILGLNISMIAEILELSRPTIYSYLKGNEPKEKSLDYKIKSLNNIIDIVKNEFKLHSFSSLFKRRDNEGKTLSDYLLDDNKNIESFVKKLCTEEIKRREKYKKRDSTKKINNELFSIPIHKE